MVRTKNENERGENEKEKGEICELILLNVEGEKRKEGILIFNSP